MGKVWLCAAVLLSFAQAGVAIGWAPISDDMSGEAGLAAKYAVQYMNFHSIFCGSGTLRQVLSASYLPSGEGGDTRLFLTMDVDVSGQNKIIMAEVVKAQGASASPWRYETLESSLFFNLGKVNVRYD